MSKSKTKFETIDYEELDEPIEEETQSDSRPDDFISILVGSLYKFDWVFLFIIAILFIIVISDVYAENVLRRFDGTFDKNDDITTKGYILQLTGLLIGAAFARITASIAGF